MKKTMQTEQTKQHLASALKEEMKRKDFDAITITDILHRSDLARPTFYYHFQDIYDLMEWMFEREAIELLKKSEDCFTWDEGMLLVLRYVQENSTVCLCALNSLRRDTLQRLFYQDVAAIMERFVASLSDGLHPKEEDAIFIRDFYTRALVSALVQWLHGGMTLSPEQMIDRIDVAMHGAVLAALQRSSERT